jgi:hypothetical protein
MQKLEKFITSVGPPSRPKFTMIGRGVAAPHIGEIYGSGSFSFFLVTSRASSQPTGSARAPHIIHQSTRLRPRRCLLDVSSIRLIPWRSYPQKTPSFWGSNGDSHQLKRLRAYLGTGYKHITMLDSSKCASRQDTQCAILKNKGWGHCRGELTKVCFKVKFTAKFQSTTENVE